MSGNKYRDYVRKKLTEREKLEQLAEEAAELAKAALKMIRAWHLSNNPARGISVDQALMDVAEEAGDVLMALDALCMSPYDTKENQKWERWAKSLGYTE